MFRVASLLGERNLRAKNTRNKPNTQGRPGSRCNVPVDKRAPLTRANRVRVQDPCPVDMCQWGIGRSVLH